MQVDVRHHADHNLVAVVDGRLLVFIRSAPLTMSALEALERQKDTLLASPLPKGVLAVFLEGGGVSKSEIVERQRVFVRDIAAAVKDISFAIAVVGDSVHASGLRAVIRFFVMGRSNMAAFRDPDEASRWLASRVGVDAAALSAATTQLAAKV